MSIQTVEERLARRVMGKLKVLEYQNFAHGTSPVNKKATVSRGLKCEYCHEASGSEQR